MRETMSSVEVLRLLYGIKEHVVDAGFPPLEFDENMSMLRGVTQSEGQNIEYFVVGIKELVESGVTDFELGRAMVPVVGAFHEVYGHGGQILNEFQKQTQLSRVLAMNYYACKGCPYYYDNFVDDSDSYKAQPYEIAAQYIGIKAAEAFLSERYDPDFAKDALCAYQAFRVRNGSALTGVNRSYKDIDEIVSDLNDQFSKCAMKHHVYDLDEIPENDDRYATSRKDMIFKYARNVKPGGDGRLIIRVMECNSGIKQDAMLTVAYLEMEKRFYDNMDPSYALRYPKVADLPVFQGDWLTHERAFGYMTQPTPERVKKKDLDLSQLDEILARIELKKEAAKQPDGGSFDI